jgi:hypothetical protein
MPSAFEVCGMGGTEIVIDGAFYAFYWWDGICRTDAHTQPIEGAVERMTTYCIYFEKRVSPPIYMQSKYNSNPRHTILYHRTHIGVSHVSLLDKRKYAIPPF